MDIDINYDKPYKFDFNEITLLYKVAEMVFLSERLYYDFSFNLNIVSKFKIKALNKKLRSIDKVTDVLSFPNIDFKRPSDFKGFIKKDVIDFSIMDIDTGTIFLGDIVICYDVLIKQAKEYMHSVKREYAFLIVHSLLHLLGYDHIKSKDEKIMLKKQDTILNDLKIYR